jgi:hypothetical protein
MGHRVVCRVRLGVRTWGHPAVGAGTLDPRTIDNPAGSADEFHRPRKALDGVPCTNGVAKHECALRGAGEVVKPEHDPPVYLDLCVVDESPSEGSPGPKPRGCSKTSHAERREALTALSGADQ